jgi:5-methylcytosine-specific restriction endonuclease McrA
MTRFVRSCLTCGRLQRDGSRCHGCQRAVDRERNARRPDVVRFYSSTAWRRLRAAVVKGASCCAWCGAGGVRLVADHIVPISRGGAPLDPANVTVACYSCNGRRRGTAARNLHQP